jgi:hypothetical protein
MICVNIQFKCSKPFLNVNSSKTGDLFRKTLYISVLGLPYSSLWNVQDISNYVNDID